MTIRFRCLAQDGHEVEVATLEDLSQRIALGELTEDTLVFDAARDGWAPLRSHEVFLTEIAPLLPPEPSGSDASDPFALSGLSLTAAETDEPSTEELVEALLRQREERYPGPAAFEDVGELPDLADLPEVSDGPSVTAGVGSGHAAVQPPRPFGDDGGRPPEAAPPSSSVRSQGPGRARYASSPRVGPRPPLRPAAEIPPRSLPAPGRRRTETGRVAAWVVGTLALSVAVVLGLARAGGEGGEEAAAGVSVAGMALAASPAEAPLPVRLTSLESEALEDMVLGMDSLRAEFDVESVPPSWLEGTYLAGAGAHPEVRYFWERYRTYVEQVRSLEGELFRRHVVAQLASQGVDGPMVSIRLARALRVFEAERPGRERVYLSMIELADASLDLHELLVEHEQEIVYEPVSAGVSREPVLEAVALTPEVGERMNLMLDRIFAAIEGVYGDRIAPREELAGALARGLSSQGS